MGVLIELSSGASSAVDRDSIDPRQFADAVVTREHIGGNALMAFGVNGEIQQWSNGQVRLHDRTRRYVLGQSSGERHWGQV